MILSLLHESDSWLAEMRLPNSSIFLPTTTNPHDSSHLIHNCKSISIIFFICMTNINGNLITDEICIPFSSLWSCHWKYYIVLTNAHHKTNYFMLKILNTDNIINKYYIFFFFIVVINDLKVMGKNQWSLITNKCFGESSISLIVKPFN